MMFPRIFIGGTGRSGTGILYRALGCHEAIYSLPTEMRFIIDPDGLINLVDALTNNYSSVQAREALFRFERLMRVDLNSPHKVPFLSYDMEKMLGKEYYWSRLDEFCSVLVRTEYVVPPEQQPDPYLDGKFTTWARRLQKLSHLLLREPLLPSRTTYNWPRSLVKEVKYFSSRKRLIDLASSFVDDLFMYAASKHGKLTWCEKTPQNLFYVGFLYELFPESVFIHIKRDPRGVVYSVTKQNWGPNDVHRASHFLKDQYTRWFDIKSKQISKDARYLELKLEDLAVSPKLELERIATFCGLEGRFLNLPDINLEKVEYWQRKMTNQEKAVVNEILGSQIESMGYHV